eukprot:CAMPEP_0206409042 /NCGR_PEP_ID=MMETSP0294-20121207/31584_1 /ASSEMBLY_ACC=CAM_ASM_000327 /TAXON_ID=39354 /ORGANISM="Heterosigma akashiwo, Strain CCMP2393" /LENGTH=32 /DNA_ID= /DNA_START= /DNA_END= /DNA_ORIENTATION=
MSLTIVDIGNSPGCAANASTISTSCEDKGDCG